MDQTKLAVRKKLRDDYKFYCEKALKIRTKEATIVPLKLNPAQQMLADVIEHQMATTGMVRIIILKARQQGLSTAVGGYLYHRVSQAQARKAIVVTHKSDSTSALFAMTKRYHENVPAILKPSTSNSSRKELIFNKLDSSYMVATAGGDGIARGETITDAHLSELAFWPTNSAEDNLNGLMESIPEVPGTSVFIESTANGVTGPFYRYWKAAEAGENGYYPLFIPWFLDPAYQRKLSEPITRTDDELEVAARAKVEWDIDLTDEQLWWRRVKISRGGLDKFRQEYPSYPDEAFLTTGRPVFDTEYVTKRSNEVGPPIRRMGHIIDKFEEHPTGELLMYEEINPGEMYHIGADVAMGVRGGDWSVAQVLDEKKNNVATYRARIHPDYFSDVLKSLGELYNNAKIAVEANNHGLLTVTKLYKELNYSNIYMDIREDQMTDVDTPMLGFKTTAKTRPLIIDAMRASLRKGELKVNDKVTLKEMLTFVVKENGKPEAEQGCHDDTVMAMAIANHTHDGVWTPVIVTDDMYHEAI